MDKDSMMRLMKGPKKSKKKSIKKNKQRRPSEKI